MKAITCTAVLLAGLLGPPSLAAAHDPKQHTATMPAAVDSVAQAAVAVVEQFSAALRTADFTRLGELLAEDALIFESGGVERSREAYLGHHAISDAQFLKAAHVQVKQRVARVDGLYAWVGTESELHVTDDGKALTVFSTETMLLKKTGADWRIVHIHWSSRTKKQSTPETL